ncbi:hypothetical protein E4T56_gene5111 [Termitomyces sp. T112]|nr:hypothetical protein E4T56_gene5111 [Termitomyces sp. T112]
MTLGPSCCAANGLPTDASSSSLLAPSSGDGLQAPVPGHLELMQMQWKPYPEGACALATPSASMQPPPLLEVPHSPMHFSTGLPPLAVPAAPITPAAPTPTPWLSAWPFPDPIKPHPSPAMPFPSSCMTHINPPQLSGAPLASSTSL